MTDILNLNNMNPIIILVSVIILVGLLFYTIGMKRDQKGDENFFRGIKCPECGNQIKNTGKEWKFGEFDAKGYRCQECGKHLSVYYKNGLISHTVPKTPIRSNN
jgi:DNA-directed RNA polymerase subunit RPC12/RpoP